MRSSRLASALLGCHARGRSVRRNRGHRLLAPTHTTRPPPSWSSSAPPTARGRSIESAARRAARATRRFRSSRSRISPVTITTSPEAKRSRARRKPSRPRALLARPGAQALRGRSREPRALRHLSRTPSGASRSDQAATGSSHERHAGPAVLWAGQPETDDALATLEALLPGAAPRTASSFASRRIRATPVTRGPLSRASGEARVFEDVTASHRLDALDAAPALVVTQFSSLAIEAGFYGIPAFSSCCPTRAARAAGEEGLRAPAALRSRRGRARLYGRGRSRTALAADARDDDHRCARIVLLRHLFRSREGLRRRRSRARLVRLGENRDK